MNDILTDRIGIGRSWRAWPAKPLWRATPLFFFFFEWPIDIVPTLWTDKCCGRRLLWSSKSDSSSSGQMDHLHVYVSIDNVYLLELFVGQMCILPLISTILNFFTRFRCRRRAAQPLQLLEFSVRFPWRWMTIICANLNLGCTAVFHAQHGMTSSALYLSSFCYPSNLLARDHNV